MRTIITTIMLLGILCASSPAGITIGFKGGASQGNNPLTGDSEITSRWELEVLGPRWLNGHLALTGAMLMPRSEDRESREIVRFIDDPPRSITIDIREELTLWDFRLGLTYWPWPQATIRPYIGAGLGLLYAEVETREQVHHDVTFLHQITKHDEDDDLYPWIVLGVECPIAETLSLLLEGQYDWSKDFREGEIGGLSFLAGLRWQW